MTQQPPPTGSAQARLTIRDAFDRFSATVTQEDRRDFSSTTLKDVRHAALQIESNLAARRSLRNTRRLQPFLQGLEHYSKTIEVLCNGTDYLPWIWAPVKLVLQVSADFLSAFEKLIEAYGKIADALPRFDRLGSALRHDHNFQAVLAFVYADILEFHRRAYKFVRMRSWNLFFNSLWNNFSSRFDSILARLMHHSELVDKEAIAVDISEAVERRKQELDRWEKQENEWRTIKHRAVMSWLQVGNTPQEDRLDNFLHDCLPGSCDWLTKHAKIKTWLNDGIANALVWLHGKPGAGKSVICSNLVQFMESRGLNVFYYFCSYLEDPTDSCARLLRSLAAQAVQANLDTAVYIHDEFIPSHPTASRRALKELLPELIESVGSAHLVIDGVDECNVKEQKIILEDILQLLPTGTSPYTCKILISSRDVPPISRGLRKKAKATTSISLRDESSSIDCSIERFIEQKLSELQDNLDELDPDGEILPQIRRMLVEKSNGMFLWVRLVLDSLETVYSPEELRHVVADLPSDLSDLYTRILERICNPRDSRTSEKASRILKWICFAQRPLSKFELLHALAISPDKTVLDSNSVPVSEVLEVCKPLVEERPDCSVVFVHFSVQEFLLKPDTSPIVRETEAHHDISFACTITLTCSLDLLDPSIAPHERLMQVGSGIYRLLPYALEYWTEHFLSYASIMGILDEHHCLPRYLSALRSKHDQLLDLTGCYRREPMHSKKDASFDKLDKRLELVAHLYVYDLMHGILQVRWLAKQESCKNGQAAETYAAYTDRTLFSKLAIDFESSVIHILAQGEVPGLSKDKLDAFKRSYASTAFRCRYHSCPNSSLGFASDQLRKQHEEVHLQRIYCKDLTCQWSRIGFRNKNGLDVHMRKDHSEKPKLHIPSTVRHAQNYGDERAAVKHDSTSLDKGLKHQGDLSSGLGKTVFRGNKRHATQALDLPPPNSAGRRRHSYTNALSSNTSLAEAQAGVWPYQSGIATFAPADALPTFTKQPRLNTPLAYPEWLPPRRLFVPEVPVEDPDRVAPLQFTPNYMFPATLSPRPDLSSSSQFPTRAPMDATVAAHAQVIPDFSMSPLSIQVPSPTFSRDSYSLTPDHTPLVP